MKLNTNTGLSALAAAAWLLSAPSLAANAVGGVSEGLSAKGASSRALVSSSSPYILAVGRLDAFDSAKNLATVLGQAFQFPADADVAGAAALLGKSVGILGTIENGSYRVDRILYVGEYVPGASRVFIRALPTHVDQTFARFQAQGLKVDFSSALFDQRGPITVLPSAAVVVAGIQPALGGIVLADAMGPRAERDAILTSKGSADASVGTGSNASVGTGRNASVGTGRNASVGTGRNASVGTGKNKGSADASVGTGSNASVGTGRNASVGTGRNASVGTGKNKGSADASVGTGSNASVGTGRNASVGTGRNASVGTGRNASVGTGRNASVGTGRP